jgi:hypothetical protein
LFAILQYTFFCICAIFATMSAFVHFWKKSSPAGKTALARRLRTSKPYLSQLAHGHRLPSPRMHELLELVTGERFSFGECLSPDLMVPMPGDCNKSNL